MLEARSCEKSRRGLDDGGESEFGVEFREWKETVLLSEGANGLTARWPRDEGGGARPLPLPRIRPPPSFRPDMVAVGVVCSNPALRQGYRLMENCYSVLGAAIRIHMVVVRLMDEAVMRLPRYGKRRCWPRLHGDCSKRFSGSYFPQPYRYLHPLEVG